MFGVGSWEIVVILVVALLVLGPDQLPKIARLVGKAMREVRRATSELRLNLELDEPWKPAPGEKPPPRSQPVAAGQDKATTEVECTPVAAADPYAAPAAAAPEPGGDGSGKPPTPRAG
ncbi:MAG: twin-arginine translocase TatA/TatE family subunit [Deltaproteobacteria bacterium]|nr:twin-arginine translocase TatA/TatE family subunit [Deltaproteobacteria bacterium]